MNKRYQLTATKINSNTEDRNDEFNIGGVFSFLCKPFQNCFKDIERFSKPFLVSITSSDVRCQIGSYRAAIIEFWGKLSKT